MNPSGPFSRIPRMKIPPLRKPQVPAVVKDIQSGAREIADLGSSALNRVKEGAQKIKRSIKSR